MIYNHENMAGKESIKVRRFPFADAFIAWRAKAKSAEAIPKELPIYHFMIYSISHPLSGNGVDHDQLFA
ncbi:hypothetical protein [Azospirillum sp. BE72]|uniref:hypothetical protein n=1 Tax=Azospirillum sp. BE72 TaxID=2817776 RepID=UPI002860C933|nr:hypothetical protein [Azospirillum sp. BE72]MDR6774079.1 hypothetical protein [Azospirillum sp. BE72]